MNVARTTKGQGWCAKDEVVQAQPGLVELRQVPIDIVILPLAVVLPQVRRLDILLVRLFSIQQRSQQQTEGRQQQRNRPAVLVTRTASAATPLSRQQNADVVV